MYKTFVSYNVIYCVLKVIRSRVKMGGAELALMLFAILYVRGVSALDECFIEDFNGSLGIMDQSCGSAEKFPVSNYDGNEDEVFIRPENSNGYFVYTTPNIAYCMSSETLDLSRGTEIYFYVYTKNPSPDASSFVVTFGPNVLLIPIENTQQWKYYKLPITTATPSNIQVLYAFYAAETFAAIDHIKIIQSGPAACDITTLPSTSTTDTSTTESVTTPTGTASTTESVTTPTGTASTTESVTTPTGTASTTESVTTPTGTTFTTESVTTPTGTTFTTESVTTPTATASTTESVTTPTGTASTTESVTTPTDIGLTESPTTPTYISTTPAVTPPPEPPVIVIPDFKTWKIISIVGLSVAGFALLYSVIVTSYLCATKNQVNRNTPGQSIPKKTEKQEEAILNDTNSIPRLQIISKGTNNGDVYYEITRKDL